jgi:hypothetical protein
MTERGNALLDAILAGEDFDPCFPSTELAVLAHLDEDYKLWLASSSSS